MGDQRLEAIMQHLSRFYQGEQTKRYFSTFITGFEQVVADSLVLALDDVKIELILDGLVVYFTSSSIEKIKKLRFLNNSFLLLRFFDKERHLTIEKMIGRVLSEEFRLPVRLKSDWRTFRIITSRENRLVSADNQLIVRLEKHIGKTTRLKPNRSKPHIEFWLLFRREEYGFWGMRLTKKGDWAKSLQKGELRPDLANILCLISEPNGNDAFLDPFAGSGAIPIERAKSFPFKRILAGDNDNRLTKRLRSKIKSLKINISVKSLDAFRLDDIRESSIDKIVTDPPWGSFEQRISNMPEFYSNMLDSFYRVLKKGGIAVLLIGERDLFENLLLGYQTKYALCQKFYILVSGKKAGAYKLMVREPERELKTQIYRKQERPTARGA